MDQHTNPAEVVETAKRKFQLNKETIKVAVLGAAAGAFTVFVLSRKVPKSLTVVDITAPEKDLSSLTSPYDTPAV